MAEVGAEFASPAEYCWRFIHVQNVMGEIQGRKMHCRILNIKTPQGSNKFLEAGRVSGEASLQPSYIFTVVHWQRVGKVTF